MAGPAGLEVPLKILLVVCNLLRFYAMRVVGASIWEIEAMCVGSKQGPGP